MSILEKLWKKKFEKRGQQAVGMSFGMIFAIFLIIVFVVVAFISIKHFLSLGQTATVGAFYEDLQNGVDDAWNGQSSSSEFTIRLPDAIRQVCFANLSAPITNGAAYEEIVKNRPYFGDFDPFGDFDLIFGASKLNLKFLEIPVRYGSRKYGTTQISRFRHGLLLLKMAAMAYRKLKAI